MKEIKNGNDGRIDELAQEIFELREICAKARYIAMDKATKLFGSTDDSEVNKALSGGGLVDGISTSVASAKSDILKVMEFVDSL
jgi:hypothetical protein